jgi:acetyl-CoA C-acetyltransferase
VPDPLVPSADSASTPSLAGIPRAVVVGTGQLRRRPELDGPWDPQEPAVLMATAIRAAIGDTASRTTGTNALTAEALSAHIETLACVDPIAWGYEDLIGTTAQFAALQPAHGFTNPPGGNSPGDLLHRVANGIADGTFSIAVVAGSEAVYSVRRARKEGMDLQTRWTPFHGRRDFLKGQRPLTTPVEARHGLVAPIQCYPLYENAIRASRGRTVAAHQAAVGRFMSRNASVAAANPNAWFPTPHSAEAITTVDAANRWVCFPYPKRMNAIMEVDQAAAIVVMAQSTADALGIARTDQIEFLGGGSCQDPWTPAERPDLARSEGIAAAASVAFEHAGVSIDDVDLIDLYSCFPSAVQFGMGAIGIAEDDPRGVTLTGGLAYAGGPGNSYALHSMCVAVDRMRTGDGRIALVTSLGMTASKHAVSILGVCGASDTADHRGTKTSLPENRLFGPPLVDEVGGAGTVVSYTVEFNRTGGAERTIYIVDLDSGQRTVGVGANPVSEAADITVNEAVGRKVMVTAGVIDADGPGTPNVVVFG